MSDYKFSDLRPEVQEWVKTRDTNARLDRMAKERKARWPNKDTENRHVDVGVPDDLRVALNVAIADVGIDCAGVPILADYAGFLSCLKDHGFEIVRIKGVSNDGQG